MFPPVSVERPNRNPPRLVRTSQLNQLQLANAGRFRKRTSAAKNCFSTWLPVADKYKIRLVGKLAKVHNAQIGNTVEVLPLKLAAAAAVGWPAS